MTPMRLEPALLSLESSSLPLSHCAPIILGLYIVESCKFKVLGNRCFILNYQFEFAPTLGVGSIDQNSYSRTWSLYQTYGNHKCSNMVANILPLDSPHPDPGGGVKIQLFQNQVMLHNKLKEMEHRASCKHIFSPYTHPQTVGLKDKNNLNVVMLHIKLRGKKYMYRQT